MSAAATARVHPPAIDSVSTVDPRAPERAKLTKVHLVLWPLVGASLTAAVMAALRADPEASHVAVEADVARVQAPAVAKPLPPPEPTPRSPSVAPPLRVSTPEPAASPSPPPEPAAIQAALAHERVTATDDYLVFAAGERARDWFAAMNVCRGRVHAGLGNWRTPSFRQLHALAKARVLPDASIWSRTRSARSEGAAFVVHGRAGTTRSAEKTETVENAVCIRKRDLPPKGP